MFLLLEKDDYRHNNKRKYSLYAIKQYMRSEDAIPLIPNSALDKTEWSASGPNILTYGKRSPRSHWLPELTGRYGEENYCSFLDSNFQSSSRSLSLY